MTILMPSDTRAALKEKAEHCASRSLYFDRFAVPGAKPDEKREWHNALRNKSAHQEKLGAWTQWLLSWRNGSGNRQRPDILYAQLQSRLMVNMAGGVMENAGLCLDRFGMPYIPGSAVKGCARRAALAALHEWSETGQKPGVSDQDQENVFKAACEPFATPAEMLAAIAQVFGWGDTDWTNTRKDGRFISDFAYACGDQLWSVVRAEAQKKLGSPFPKQFAGAVSFLPAYPVDLGKTGKVEGLPCELPPLGKLELDIVTCHHQIYYSAEPDRQRQPDKWREWQEHRSAPDTEEPNPVFFPAVAAGHVFAFALLPLRNCSRDCLEQARTWLAEGLAAFGLGAKTAAGYGWFNCAQEVQRAVSSGREEMERKKAEDRRRAEEETRRQREEQERQRKAAELKAATENMTPDEKADFEIKDWDNNRLFNHFDRFAQLTTEQKAAIYRLLRGRKADLWHKLRKAALEGTVKERKRWGNFVQVMFQMAKQRKEKMP